MPPDKGIGALPKAEPPATRQTRRNYEAAVTRMRRQAHPLQHSMNAQDQARTRHPLQRAEARRKAADATVARPVRRDAGLSDAFDHLA